MRPAVSPLVEEQTELQGTMAACIQQDGKHACDQQPKLRAGTICVMCKMNAHIRTSGAVQAYPYNQE